MRLLQSNEKHSPNYDTSQNNDLVSQNNDLVSHNNDVEFRNNDLVSLNNDFNIMILYLKTMT